MRVSDAVRIAAWQAARPDDARALLGRIARHEPGAAERLAREAHVADAAAAEAAQFLGPTGLFADSKVLLAAANGGPTALLAPPLPGAAAVRPRSNDALWGVGTVVERQGYVYPGEIGRLVFERAQQSKKLEVGTLRDLRLTVEPRRDARDQPMLPGKNLVRLPGAVPIDLAFDLLAAGYLEQAHGSREALSAWFNSSLLTVGPRD